jgi:hypothetical protein
VEIHLVSIYLDTPHTLQVGRDVIAGIARKISLREGIRDLVSQGCQVANPDRHDPTSHLHQLLPHARITPNEMLRKVIYLASVHDVRKALKCFTEDTSLWLDKATWSISQALVTPKGSFPGAWLRSCSRMDGISTTEVEAPTRRACSRLCTTVILQGGA